MTDFTTDTLSMKDRKSKTNLYYQDSGVNVDRGDSFVESIKPLAASTSRDGEMGNIGGFGGLFDITKLGYRDPVIVASTDGVGTKLLVALEHSIHDEIGIDLVAMCVNDIIVQGAEPLFFLDYFATDTLDPIIGETVVSGIADGCRQAGVLLLGGETAEMPGLYSGGHYDLAGFSVGIVEREKLIDGKSVAPGDVILGLSSSGFHSNGFSLIRKISETAKPNHTKPSAVDLLRPTKIYVKSVLTPLKNHEIKAIAHITGGGLTNNIPRVLPPNLCARIQLDSWPLAEIFHWIANAGPVEELEMLKTFNCGIGMILIVSSESADEISSTLRSLGEEVHVIGEITDESVPISYTGSLLA